VAPVGCKLLIADDNRDAVDSMAMIMELSGHMVSVAYTGRGALEAVRQHWPDAVLLDIGMPDMTGYDVARAIREIDRERPICLIAVTGWGQMEDRARTRAAGFDHHLTKPVDPDQVTDLLREHLSTRAGG
jgi:CheY-like chemotaxis protein